MFLGGALVLVLVNSLTVVQSLFMLNTSGLICVMFFPSVLFEGVTDRAGGWYLW